MSDEIEHRVIDTRVRPSQQVDLPSDPDLVIDITLEEGKYNVTYTQKIVGVDQDEKPMTEYVPIFFFALTREEMVQHHVQQMLAWKPKTVVITAGEQRTSLHPGVVKSIIEGKLGVAELVLR